MAVIINGDTGIDTIVDGSVTTADLATGAVGTTQLAATLDLSGKTMTYGNLPAANLTGSLPAGMGGKILQVVTNTFTSIATYNVNAWTIISQLDTSITPSSTSSKIFVYMMINKSGWSHWFRLYRNGSAISGALGDAATSRSITTFMSPQSGSVTYDTSNNILMYLDSPSSTSTQTYQLAAYPKNDNTFFINRAATDDTSGNSPRTISTVTLMEVGT